MSSATEIPDILGSITHAIGLNRLWESDQQADVERRKSEKEGETDRPGCRTQQDTTSPLNDDIAPVLIAKEREKGEEKARKLVDHDGDIHGVSIRERREVQPKKTAAYEWPMPASLKRNQAKKKVDAEPTIDNKTAPTEEYHDTATDGATSKSSRMASQVPFIRQHQGGSPRDVEDSTAAGQSSPDGGATFSRPRLYSSSSQQPLERPKPRATRQNTMPAHTSHDGDPESRKHRSAARSRWISATQGLRFPLRKKRITDKLVAAAKGTEVVTSLIAGAPAATIVGMHMIPDERGHPRIPVIVDLLKVSLQ